MTREEMKQGLLMNGVPAAVIEKTAEKFNIEMISTIIEIAVDQKEAFEALHYVYPELEGERLMEQMAMIQKQVEKAMTHYSQGGKKELSESDLSHYTGGNVFCDVANWFKKNWKAVLIGAAVVIGCAEAVGLMGIGNGFFGSVLDWGPESFGLGGNIAAMNADGSSFFSLF